MMRTLFVAIVVAGCGPAVPPPQAAQAGSGSSNVVCHDVTDTGTMVTRQECVTEERKQDEHDDTVRDMSKGRTAGRTFRSGARS